MKNLKKFNEFFDNEDLKANDEIGFLQGKTREELTQITKDVVSGATNTTTDKSFPSNLKSVRDKLLWDIPYLNKMSLRTDNKKTLFLTNPGYEEQNDSYCYITLSVNDDETIVPSIECEIINDSNESVFKKRSDDKLMEIEELVDLLKGKYFNIVNEWDSYNDVKVFNNEITLNFRNN